MTVNIGSIYIHSVACLEAESGQHDESSGSTFLRLKARGTDGSEQSFVFFFTPPDPVYCAFLAQGINSAATVAQPVEVPHEPASAEISSQYSTDVSTPLHRGMLGHPDNDMGM